MVIHNNKIVEVKLKLIPEKWKFAIESAKKAKNQGEIDVFDPCIPDLPISVKSPLSSAYGIAKRCER